MRRDEESRSPMMIARFWRRTGVAIVVALGLAGCAGPEGFLVPVPSDARAPGATHEDMLVVTTRTRRLTRIPVCRRPRAAGRLR